MKKSISIAAIILCSLCCFYCEEGEESIDNNNDIIIRNLSEHRLWILIDGQQMGSIPNDGIARTMWDGIGDGSHSITAYKTDQYTDYHCGVTTPYLEGGDDFLWYLEQEGQYSGSTDGYC